MNFFLVDIPHAATVQLAASGPEELPILFEPSVRTLPMMVYLLAIGILSIAEEGCRPSHNHRTYHNKYHCSSLNFLKKR